MQRLSIYINHTGMYGWLTINIHVAVTRVTMQSRLVVEIFRSHSGHGHTITAVLCPSQIYDYHLGEAGSQPLFMYSTYDVAGNRAREAPNMPA